ncbi:MAG TPA: tetratricopeptide repeat protein [Candidatus Angelobacter sp.]|nr:tetratricopeptide repeat protein [Candidatus Angelobacter sp.]
MTSGPARTTAKPAALQKSTEPDLWQAALPALLLALIVIIAYIPALHGQFIWDDDSMVTNNLPLRSLTGLWHIWFVPGATQQYYPLTYTSFWIDYHLWGLHPFAYHFENIFLHAIDAILVWRILRRLNVKGAWLGAALFAVHPVCVESVAWIAERKNTLSVFFFLLSTFAAIEFWLPRQKTPAAKTAPNPESPCFGPQQFYWLALALYVCALWTKTAIVGLPCVILLLTWWKRGRLRWKDIALTLPFFAVGLAIGLFTTSIEHHFVLAAGDIDEWKLSLGQKFIIAGRAFWFYLGKLCWPHPLMFFYPRWVLHAAQPLEYLPLAAAVALFVVLWWKRRAGTLPLLLALAYFVIMLFPALGFVNIFPFRYSFVADHFQYAAAIGPFAFAGAGITSLFRKDLNREREATSLTADHHPLRHEVGERDGVRWRSGFRGIQFWLIAAGLTVLAVLTWLQTGIYRNLEILWRDTIAHNPASWAAHDNLGRYLVQFRRFDEAESEFHQAIAIRPNDHIAYYDLGLEAAIEGHLNDAVADFNKTLELNPDFATAHFELGNVFTREGALTNAIQEYNATLKALPKLTLAHFNLANALAQNGQTDDAIAEYHRTIEVQPDYIPAHITLGRTLAAKGNTDDAITQYHIALAIDPNSVEAMADLGNALVAKGQLDQAATCYRTALQLAPDNPTIHFNLSVVLQRQGKSAEAQSERLAARRLQTQHQ